MIKYGKKGNAVAWILTVLIVLGLAGAVIGLSIQLSRTETTTLGGEAYSIGALDEETGEYAESTTSIYTRKSYSVSGLKCELSNNAMITYQLFFYDKDGKFVSSTLLLTSDFNGTVPAEAATFKVLITPTNDEDGKVSVVEVLGYANQLTVIYGK